MNIVEIATYQQQQLLLEQLVTVVILKEGQEKEGSG